MDYNFKKTKIFLFIGFLVAFIIFSCSPLFAFEGFDVECVPYWNDGTSANDYFQFADPDYPDSAFYSPSYNGTQAKEIGLYTGFPVPYYADGDHYSIFLNFSIGVPASALTNNWLGLYIKPQASSTSMGTSAGGQYIIANVGVYNPYGSSGNSAMYSGTFTWQGNTTCNYKILMTCFIDDSVSVGAQQWIYNFSCVFDLNLEGGSGLAADELRPFAISAKYYLGYPTSGTSNYGLGLLKRYSCRATDTSLYGLLENIESAVSSIDFSGLSGLADLSVTVENFYDEYINNMNIQIPLLESIYDDGETDEDVTRWGDIATEFNENNNILHSLENEMMGTIDDFTLPSVTSSAEATNLFSKFFENEIIILLTTISLCLAIVFCILL